MSKEEVLNKIDYSFEYQLNKIREYKKNIHSTFEKIINIFENNNDVQIDNCYADVSKSDDSRISFNIKVSIPINDSICSTIRLIIHTIDPNKLGIKKDYTSDLDKMNIEYGKKYLKTLFNKYFEKCNFEYVDSTIRIENRIILEINLRRREYYSDIV